VGVVHGRPGRRRLCRPPGRAGGATGGGGLFPGDLGEIVGDDPPADPAPEAIRAMVAAPVEPVVAPQHVDPPFQPRPEPETAPEPALSLVPLARRRRQARLGQGDTSYAPLLCPRLILGRVQAAIPGDQVGRVAEALPMGVDAQPPPARDAGLLRQGDHPVVEGRHRVRADERRPADERRAVRHGPQIDAAELPQHEAIAHETLDLGVAPAVQSAHEQQAQDDLDRRGGPSARRGPRVPGGEVGAHALIEVVVVEEHIEPREHRVEG